jgi:hypothetical protein
MAVIVMRPTHNLPRAHRQQRARPVQGLNLGFLIHAQNQRFVWGLQGEAHNIAPLLDKQGIGRQFERLRPMRLQAKGPRQMRCTVLRLTPLVCAMARVLQCVAWVGVLSRVWVTIRSTAVSVTVLGAPGRGSSSSPSRRWVIKRCRHLQTVCGATRTARATARFVRPSAQVRIIPARCTTA